MIIEKIQDAGRTEGKKTDIRSALRLLAKIQTIDTVLEIANISRKKVEALVLIFTRNKISQILIDESK